MMLSDREIRARMEESLVVRPQLSLPEPERRYLLMAMNLAKRINTRAELLALADDLGVRKDWHEPDEQDLTAQVRGTSFDNAGFWPAPTKYWEEMHVVLFQYGKPVAEINLATLFAWATGLED